MDQAAFQNVLTAILGPQGLNIAHTLQASQQNQRELSIVKVPDFWGKDEENPYEWIDQFN